MKNPKKFVRMTAAVLFTAAILSLAGCGRNGEESERTDAAVAVEIPEADTETAKAQDNAQEQDGKAGSNEELLERIDGDDGTDTDPKVWTQEMIDEADRRDRAILEEKIQAAGGISEEEAIAIAEKAMEADLGEKAKELEVIMSPSLAPFGWKVYLFDITDWPEYKDKGDIAYSVDFGNKEKVVEPKDFCRYNCFVNAVDGSICGAYSLSGDVGPDWDIDDIVWYDH